MHVGDCGVTTAAILDFRVSDSPAFNDGPPSHGYTDIPPAFPSNSASLRGIHGV